MQKAGVLAGEQTTSRPDWINPDMATQPSVTGHIDWNTFLRFDWHIAVVIVVVATLLVPPAWLIVLWLRRAFILTYLRAYDRSPADQNGRSIFTSWGAITLTMFIEALAPAIVFAFMVCFLPTQFRLERSIVITLGLIALSGAAFASWIFIAPPSLVASLVPVRAAILYALILGYAGLTVRVLHETNDPTGEHVYADLATIGHLVVLAVIWMASPKWLKRLSPLSEA